MTSTHCEMAALLCSIGIKRLSNEVLVVFTPHGLKSCSLPNSTQCGHSGRICIWHLFWDLSFSRTGCLAELHVNNFDVYYLVIFARMLLNVSFETFGWFYGLFFSDQTEVSVRVEHSRRSTRYKFNFLFSYLCDQYTIFCHCQLDMCWAQHQFIKYWKGTRVSFAERYVHPIRWHCIAKMIL